MLTGARAAAPLENHWLYITADVLGVWGFKGDVCSFAGSFCLKELYLLSSAQLAVPNQAQLLLCSFRKSSSVCDKSGPGGLGTTRDPEMLNPRPSQTPCG